MGHFQSQTEDYRETNAACGRVARGLEPSALKPLGHAALDKVLVACVAGGISRASAFVLVAKP